MWFFTFRFFVSVSSMCECFHSTCVKGGMIEECYCLNNKAVQGFCFGDRRRIIKPGIHLRQRQAEARRDILGTPCRGLKNFFSFCEARLVLSILRIGRGTPWACLTSIYQHAMARIAAASEACGWARCAVYTSWGEAVMLRPGLPLP